MKKIQFILLALLFTLRSWGQVTIVKPILTEYRSGFLCSDQNIHSYLNPTNGSSMISLPLPGSRLVADAAGGFNSYFAAATDGTGWINYNDGTSNYYQCQDSSGNTSLNMIAPQAMRNQYVYIRSTDSAAMCGGYDTIHIFHTTGYDSARFINIGGSLKFKKILIGYFRILGLTTTGLVYQWPRGTGSYTPVQMTLPAAGYALDIWCSHYDYAGCIIPNVGETSGYGWPYVWGSQNGAWQGNSSYTQPTAIASQWGITTPVKQVASGWNATQLIDSLARMWSNAYCNTNGELGNGTEFANKYNYPQPYSWTLIDGENPSGATMVQIGIGIAWSKLYNFNTFYQFYEYAGDASGNFYAWGTNKSYVLNGYNCLQSATYRNALDILVPTEVNPLDSTYSAYNFTLPAISAGSNQSITGSTGTLTQSGHPALLINNSNSSDTLVYRIVAYAWSCTAKPVGAATPTFGSSTTKTTTVSGLVTGSYTFQIITTDNNTGTAIASVTWTVTVPNQTSYYVADAGSGTACTHSLPCPVSYIPTILPFLGAGDTMYLNRGDVFAMDISITTSGSVGNDIIIEPYGTGSDPIIGGIATLTFSNTGTNLWEATGSWPTPRLLIESGLLAGKSGTSNSYQTFIPASGSTTDLHFASNPFNVGDSIAIKSSGYTFDFAVCTASTSTDATISPAMSYNNVGGNGAFKIGGIPTVPGAWNLPSAGTVQVYSTSSPSGYQVPNVGIPLTLSGNYIKVTGIRIAGADTTCILLSGSHDVITNDTLEYGVDWIQTLSATSDTITNNYIAHFGNGMRKSNTANYNNIWENNTITDCGMIPGMGTTGSTYQTYSALIAGDSGNVVKFNNISQVGYLGIGIYGQSFIADSNLINTTCQQLPDGGGIYTYVSTSTTFNWRHIVGNTIRNTGGSQTLLGTNLTAESDGIYLDNWSSQDSVLDNSIDSSQGFAIYDHGPHNVIEYNNCYGDGTTEFFAGEVNALTITGLVVKYNQFCSSTPGTLPMWIYTVNNDLSSFGSLDSNSYFSYRQLIGGWKTQSSVDPGTSRTIASWQSTTSYDPASIWLSGPTLFLMGGLSGQTYNLGAGLYMDNSGNLYFGTIAIPAYQSKILIQKNLSYITGPTNTIILTR